MSTAFSLAPLFRSSVGFDRFNDLFETALRNEPGSTYPPYNVEKHGDDQYRIVDCRGRFPGRRPGAASRERCADHQWRQT